jgi:hypothetical protein
MVTAVTRLVPAAAALLLAACNSGFAPQYRVDDVRLLDVRSRLPAGASADVAPGDTLVLDALVANPRARPDLAVTWYACLPPASDAVPPCANETYLADPHRLATVPGVLSLGVTPAPPAGPDPTAVASVALPLVDPATVTSLADALRFVVETATLIPTFRCRLYAELVVVAVAEAGGLRSTAVKRVRVVVPPGLLPDPTFDLYQLNLNPRAAEVVRDPDDEEKCTGGISIATPPFPLGKRTLCGKPASGAAQQVLICNPDGTTTPAAEDLEWQWYVTAGEFPDESGGVGNAQGGHVAFTRPSGPFWLWAILRDRRGGSDWVSYAVTTP